MAEEMLFSWLFSALQILCIYLAICVLVPPLFRKRPEQNATGPDERKEITNPPSHEFVRSVETSRDALAVRLALIQNARSEIDLSTFIWLDDDSGRDISAALICAARRGVRIRVLADYYGVSRAIRLRAHFRSLASMHNITVKFYNRASIFKFWRINYRMHDKFLIVDSSAYLLGGRNISNHSLGTYRQDVDIDRDLLVCTPGDDEASSIRQLKAYFESSFGEKCSREFHPHRPRSAVKAIARAQKRFEDLRENYPELDDPGFLACGLSSTESIELLHNGTNPGNKTPNVLARLRSLAASGKDVLAQTPYAVLDWSMFGRRPKIPQGKRTVRVMTNAPELGANLFGCGEYLLHWHGLRATGAKIFEWAHGPSIHAKSVIVDDEMSIVGSYNLDLRSTYLDTELMLAVKSRNLSEQIRGHIEAMAKECCALEPKTLTRIENSRRIVRHARSQSKAFLRLITIRAKLDLSRTSGILLMPFRYLI